MYDLVTEMNLEKTRIRDVSNQRRSESQDKDILGDIDKAVKLHREKIKKELIELGICTTK